MLMKSEVIALVFLGISYSFEVIIEKHNEMFTREINNLRHERNLMQKVEFFILLLKIFHAHHKVLVLNVYSWDWRKYIIMKL